MTIRARFALLLAVLLTEALAASGLFDARNLFLSLGDAKGAAAAGVSLWLIHFSIGFAALFCTFCYLQHAAALRPVFAGSQAQRFQIQFFAAHCAAFAAFLSISNQLSQANSYSLLLVPWLLSGCTAVVCAILACVPFSIWRSVFRIAGPLTLYTALGAFLAASAVAQSWRLWQPLSSFTFSLVAFLLKPVLPHMIVDPQRLIIGSGKFRVMVASSCSGLEGAALLIVFLALWLIVLRKEVRFPQALLLLPAGVALLLLLNAARIAALVWIGHAGWPEIAKGGFHSQAGWIAFNFVAFGMSVTARRIPWITCAPPGHIDRALTEANAVAVYLLPFLALLGAGMLARAASGNFEWLYGIRILIVAVPLWCYRTRYAALLTKPEWPAVAIGMVVFLIWIALDRFWNSSAFWQAEPHPLQTAAPAIRIGWISLRFVTAVALVPLAEELAFRGYLMRRLVREDFEAVSPRESGLFAVATSSLVFGALHGPRWFAGFLAGLLYATVYRSRGNLASAIVAHGVTNLLLAVYVLTTGSWGLW